MDFVSIQLFLIICLPVILLICYSITPNYPIVKKDKIDYFVFVAIYIIFISFRVLRKYVFIGYDFLFRERLIITVEVLFPI